VRVNTGNEIEESAERIQFGKVGGSGGKTVESSSRRPPRDTIASWFLLQGTDADEKP